MATDARRLELLSYAARVLPDLKAARDRVQHAPEEVMQQAFPEADPGLRARAIVVAAGEADDPAVVRAIAEVRDERRRVLEAGADAVDVVEQEGASAPLSPEQHAGLEAIVVVVARPAILMRDGKFPEAPAPWEETLGPYRGPIAEASSRIGRVEVSGLPDHPYGGTGFLVAPDTVMTNCHVAMLFARSSDAHRWTFQDPVRSSVAFVDDPGTLKETDPLPGFDVTEIIGIHDRLDLALLRVQPKADGQELPEPLTILGGDPGPIDGRLLYVIGYPAPDYRNDPDVQRRIFGDRFFVKRLQPGAGMATPVGADVAPRPCSPGLTADDVLFHDASTLGGNSGSAVVDLETNLVIGLHFSGAYLQYNRAVALWRLNDDPLLTAAGVRFD